MFDQIYKQYQNKIKGFTYKLCKQFNILSLREDIEQEVILQLLAWYKKNPTTTINSSFIYTMIKNHCINTKRTYNTQTALQSELKNRIEYVEPSTCALARCENKQFLNTIQTIIDKELSPRLRDVFQLYLAGHPGKEIAKILNIPSATVRTRILRTREQIKKRLQEHYKPKEAQNVESCSKYKRKS